MPFASILGWLCLALAAIGCAYMLAAAATIVRFFAASRVAARSNAAVTILKPLHGGEPRLADNLATFLAQDHDGPIQLLCGIQRKDDPAIPAVEELRRRYPDARIDLIVDPTPHGSNGKVANLINMEPHIAHDIVVLSDSDMAVPSHYLAQLIAALDRPRVGAVTCLYCGRGDAGFWSRLGAAGLSYQFLPNATFATAIGQIGDACMGSTIALRRETLDAIGGFTAFADILADDHALGGAVRAQGLDIVIPPMLLIHGSDEAGFDALWRHELRWAATVRGLTPAIAHAGSLITFPFPLAVIGAFFHPAAGIALALVALTTRIVVAGVVDTVARASTVAKWLLPARDFLSLAIFVASYTARSVDWRGSRLTMGPDGRIAPETESQDR
jgi:ceramide glucosyltransferase